MDFLTVFTYNNRLEFMVLKNHEMQAMTFYHFRLPWLQRKFKIQGCRTNKERYNFQNSKIEISIKIYISIQKNEQNPIIGSKDMNV